MGGEIKKTNQNPKLGEMPAQQEFEVLDIKAKEEKQKKQQNALLIDQLEEFTKSLVETQTSEGKEQLKENITLKNSPAADPSNESSKDQIASGMNFFISNNIPFSMFVDMIQERLKQLNNQSEGQQQISLAYVGKNKTVGEDGKVSYSDQSGGGIIDMICSTIIAGANADSVKTFLNATQTLSQSANVLGSACGLIAGGNTKAEDAHVDRLTNAVDTIHKIPAKDEAIVGENQAAQGNNGAQKNEQALQTAIAALQTEHGAQKIRLGSIKNAKGGYEKVELEDPKYLSQAEGSQDPNAREHITGGNTQDDSFNITAEDAIKGATSEQKKSILAHLDKELKLAKERVQEKSKKIENFKNLAETIAKASTGSIGGGMSVQSAKSDADKGQANAEQQAYTAVQTALSKMADTQDKGVDNRKSAIDQANQDLQKIISTVGQRG
jgi:hypothetical protein